MNSILSFGFTSVLFQANYNPQPPATGSSVKLDQVQGQVNEVKVILKDNINKVLERGDRLDDLMDKTGDLQATVSIVLADEGCVLLSHRDLTGRPHCKMN